MKPVLPESAQVCREVLASVIVPVYDGSASLGACLDALLLSNYPNFEVLVVDDGSTDGSSAVARARGLSTVRLPARSGPSAARNVGAAHARGEVFFFLDADCEIHRDTLARAMRRFETDRTLDAVFGSYDSSPTAPGVVSRHKNLRHFWTHQRSAGPVKTFWAGCGAVRRSSFRSLGGFDARRFPLPSVEDVDFGYRLSEGGGRIELDRDLLVSHSKLWTLNTLVRTDLLQRAVPWTELLLERSGRFGGLSVDRHEMKTVGLGSVTVVAAAGIPVLGVTTATVLSAVAVLLLLIRHELPFLRFLWRCSGALQAITAVPLLLLHGIVASVGFAIGLARSLATLSRVHG